MQYLDPEGCELRRAHRLRRRVYHNAGQNAVWPAFQYMAVSMGGRGNFCGLWLHTPIIIIII